MDRHKKSIVNYEDDDDDEQTEKISSKESHRSSHQRRDGAVDKRKKDHHHHRQMREERRKESYRSDRHSSHRHSSRSSRDDRHRDGSSSHSRRRRSRSRSYSRGRDSHHRHSKSNQNKSRRDRSRSRSKEFSSRNDRRYRSRSKSPKRQNSKEFHSLGKNETVNKITGIVKPFLEKQPIPIDTKSTYTGLNLNVQTNQSLLVEPKVPIIPQSISVTPSVMVPAIPKYYNAKVVNPLKIATQEEKRKLLWGDTKKDKPSSSSSTNVWTNLKFQGERGSQMTEKFRKLMGIKEDDDDDDEDEAMTTATNEAITSNDNTTNSSLSTTQEKLFQNLDMQYSIARMSTHTHRGVGLGFGSSNRLT
ncbi:hypothetical protein RDWZM_008084 [Blomia tropicalis]|uniref:Small acidic protein-like domain-containing protein n=1 Tax=Blomia tropicalis TaxID=40697 RepID=A0A9Q0M2V9_BLOTA|nr:hypothetical protein RDWZM_008084 [Blomia tropicalis]